MRSQTVLMSLTACLVLVGCKGPINPNDLPVSYWADPKTIGADGFGYADSCSVASAQAIVKSGLPFPNYGTRDEIAADGKTAKKRITTVDFWLGGVRFVFPAVIASSGSFPVHNPNRYNGLQGTLPHFYPKGNPAPAKDGMGAMVDVKFICSMESRYVNHKRHQSNAEGIQATKAAYEKKLADSPLYPGKVTVNIRKDLGMTEVLLERQKLQPEATYWPLNRELRDSLGAVRSISCAIRNDPSPEKRYGGVGHRCGVSIGMTANAHASVSIYVAHLDQMPGIFDQVQQVISDAKKAAE